jgi:hypothetical protein
MVKRISKTGRFPDDPGGYSTQWDRWRDLRIATNDPVLQWDKDNVLAIRVYDGGGIGGMFGGIPGISMLQLKDMASLEYKNKALHFRHQLPEKITGVLTIKITDPATQTEVKNYSQTITVQNLTATILYRYQQTPRPGRRLRPVLWKIKAGNWFIC